MWWEILKASNGLPVTDQYAALWGKKIAEAGSWKVTEITGELPLIFLSDGSVLVDYRIYGTSANAGVETENLFDFDEYTIGDTLFATKLLTLEPNTAYTMSSNAPRYNRGALIALIAINESTTTSNNGVYEDHPITKTTDASGKIYVGLRDNGSGYDLSTYKTMLVKGSTPPSTYIPHGYKLPLTVTNGAQSQDIPVYIGNSKLGEEEYVDYETGKIYRMTSGALTPTDPPAPLPPIPTYKGENTLSSTETLGEVTIKGRIKEVDS